MDIVICFVFDFHFTNMIEQVAFHTGSAFILFIDSIINLSYKHLKM